MLVFQDHERNPKFAVSAVDMPFACPICGKANITWAKHFDRAVAGHLEFQFVSHHDDEIVDSFGMPIDEGPRGKVHEVKANDRA